jgi:hypothetical protein
MSSSSERRAKWLQAGRPTLRVRPHRSMEPRVFTNFETESTAPPTASSSKTARSACPMGIRGLNGLAWIAPVSRSCFYPPCSISQLIFLVPLRDYVRLSLPFHHKLRLLTLILGGPRCCDRRAYLASFSSSRGLSKVKCVTESCIPPWEPPVRLQRSSGSLRLAEGQV